MFSCLSLFFFLISLGSHLILLFLERLSKCVHRSPDWAKCFVRCLQISFSKSYYPNRVIYLDVTTPTQKDNTLRRAKEYTENSENFPFLLFHPLSKSKAFGKLSRFVPECTIFFENVLIPLLFPGNGELRTLFRVRSLCTRFCKAIQSQFGNELVFRPSRKLSFTYLDFVSSKITERNKETKEKGKGKGRKGKEKRKKKKKEKNFFQKLSLKWLNIPYLVIFFEFFHFFSENSLLSDPDRGMHSVPSHIFEQVIKKNFNIF